MAWCKASGMLLILALAGCVGGTASKDDTGEGQGGDRTVEGVVVDDAIRPVEGANVVLGQRNATTGPDGLFRFEGVPAGSYVVRASRTGYSDGVAQVSVTTTGEVPFVKLILAIDPNQLAYAQTISIDGFVECGTYTAPYRFAACGTANVASIILCTSADICQGNITQDRYIVVKALDSTPDFLQVEVVWEPTQETGDQFSILIGSATAEELRQPTSRVYNDTAGPSPLVVTMDKETLEESGIGKDAYFLSQTFAYRSSMMPCVPVGCLGLGVVAQQEFQLFLTMFYGYAPPADWRFTDGTGLPPPP